MGQDIIYLKSQVSQYKPAKNIHIRPIVHNTPHRFTVHKTPQTYCLHNST